MCYYRRLHFVPCSHLFRVANPVIRYCPAALPILANGDFARISPERSLSRGANLHPPSTPSSSPARRHSRPSILSTPLGKSEGDSNSSIFSIPLREPDADSMTSTSSLNFSPPPHPHPEARRPSNQTQQSRIPCSIRLSHPFTTYRIHSVCPSCKARREKEDARLGNLKEGLGRVRWAVERLGALEDMRARAEQADGEREEEEKNLKGELKRLRERIGRLEESGNEEPVVQMDDDEGEKEDSGRECGDRDELKTVY